MKYLLILTLFVCSTFVCSAQSQKPKLSTSKQYRSAKTGRFVTKKTATKSPSTTYSTTKKSKK